VLNADVGGAAEFVGRARWSHCNVPEVLQYALVAGPIGYKQKFMDFSRYLTNIWDTVCRSCHHVILVANVLIQGQNDMDILDSQGLINIEQGIANF
jgi:hypothetical protein